MDTQYPEPKRTAEEEAEGRGTKRTRGSVEAAFARLEQAITILREEVAKKEREEAAKRAEAAQRAEAAKRAEAARKAEELKRIRAARAAPPPGPRVVPLPVVQTQDSDDEDIRPVPRRSGSELAMIYVRLGQIERKLDQLLARQVG